MIRMVCMIVSVAAGLLLCQALADGGAKDGKVRWTWKKTGACKVNPPIIVPKAENGKPGVATIELAYKGKELAEFVVMGDGDTDLDVIVKDSKGKIVAKDEDPPAEMGGGSDICILRWTPDQDEIFTIFIVNHGRVENYIVAGSN